MKVTHLVGIASAALLAVSSASLIEAAGGFFSVGGRLTNRDVDPQEGNSFLWRNSSSYGLQRLLVTTDECGYVEAH